MTRLFVLLVLGGAACVTASRPTMYWPASPPTAALEPPADKAVGGGLETEPMRPGVHRVVSHDSDAVAPPGAPRDGKSYLVLQWPLPATGVNSLYGTRVDPMDSRERQHNGVDLEAAYGAVVAAAADGIVVWAGWNAGHGRQVLVEHAGGFRTGYSHLSQVLTYPGLAIRSGDPVGLVGNSGRSTGPHLHFEVIRDEIYVDPLDVLGLPQRLD